MSERLEVFLSKTTDGAVHAFAKEESETTMCGKRLAPVTAGDEDDLVCECCAVEMVAALGLTPAQTEEFGRMLEDILKR